MQRRSKYDTGVYGWNIFIRVKEEIDVAGEEFQEQK